MNTLEHIDNWTEEHTAIWIDFLRICFGLFLVVKGAFLAEHNEVILNLLHNSSFELLPFVAIQYVIFAETIGGILIALGVVTRTTALFELPILIGAVFFVNLPHGFSFLNIELGYSVLALLLTIFFIFYGSGQLSFDHYLKTHKDR